MNPDEVAVDEADGESVDEVLIRLLKTFLRSILILRSYLYAGLMTGLSDLLCSMMQPL